MKTLYDLFNRSMGLKLFCSCTMLLYGLFHLYRILQSPVPSGGGPMIVLFMLLFILFPVRNIILLLSSRTFSANRGLDKQEQIEKFSSLNLTHWIIEGVAMIAVMLIFLILTIFR